MGCQGRKEDGVEDAKRETMAGRGEGREGGSCFRMAVLKNKPPPPPTYIFSSAPCDLPRDQNTAAAKAGDAGPHA